MIAASALALALAGVEPAAGTTRGKAEGAFIQAVMFSCLTSQEQDVRLAALPPEYVADLMPAPADDFEITKGHRPADRVWISRTWGSHLHVIEVAAGRCLVEADQLPVAETLDHTAQALGFLKPPYATVPVEPGYNPVVHQLERVTGGRKVSVRLEGAEPGLPGHASRFSLLTAVVTAGPAGP